jgi:hypothetical protein
MVTRIHLYLTQGVARSSVPSLVRMNAHYILTKQYGNRAPISLTPHQLIASRKVVRSHSSIIYPMLNVLVASRDLPSSKFHYTGRPCCRDDRKLENLGWTTGSRRMADLCCRYFGTRVEWAVSLKWDVRWLDSSCRVLGLYNNVLQGNMSFRQVTVPSSAKKGSFLARSISTILIFPWLSLSRTFIHAWHHT